MPAMTQGLHHLGLTVTDLSAARGFFVDVLGFDQVGEKPDYPAVFVSDGVTMLTLWRAQDPATAAHFDRKNNVGLHHFALKVDDLDAVHAKVVGVEGVTVEFPPEAQGTGGARHMMVAIPGGPRMEFLQPPA